MAAEINFYDNLHSVILKMPTGLHQKNFYEIHDVIFTISTRWQQRIIQDMHCCVIPKIQKNGSQKNPKQTKIIITTYTGESFFKCA